MRGGSASLIFSFKAQLYIKTDALLYASNKQNLNLKKTPFKMATQTMKYLGKNKSICGTLMEKIISPQKTVKGT